MTLFTQPTASGDSHHRTLRHSALLTILVILIIVEPFTRAEITWVSFLVAMSVAALLLDGRRRRTQVAAAVVGIPAVLLLVGTFCFPGHGWWKAFIQGMSSVLIQIWIIAALFYCCYLILNSLLRARKITANEILGTISLYLMVGLIWAIIYVMLEREVPGSFSSVSPLFSAENTSPFVYFSFVTQASLGYGDIAPQLPLASRLVIIQSVMGQFYVAVVVAYLIAIFISQRKFG